MNEKKTNKGSNQEVGCKGLDTGTNKNKRMFTMDDR